ncbi:MAG: hypothetical protein J0I41_11905 [Filimonas sp.]|nr:hypothetical protein [Filimonas sp.]
MKQTLIFLILILKILFAKADLPGSAYQYTLYSQNGKFYYKSIPFYNYDQTNFGKTMVYDAKTKKKLYQIDNYLARRAFISNNGKSLVTTTYWMWGHDNYENQPLIEFYINGKKGKSYFVDDLSMNKTKLIKTSSHTLWYDQMFINNDTLFILTLDNKAILIDVNKAEIVGKMDEAFILNRFNKKKLPELKSTVQYDIKYPDRYQFPDLANGKDFRSALKDGLNKKETATYDSSKYYIMVYGTVDKQGKCELFTLSTSVDGKDNEAWSKEVAGWITKQRYKINLIPVNCDKWVFEEYFYLIDK